MANQSEKQLKRFLKFKLDGGFKISLRLEGQGDSSSFCTKKAVNLCTVIIDKNKYLFGGISEKFYDKMVDKFHEL